MDPNEAQQDPQDEQVEQPTQPEAPSMDPRMAIEIAAQQFGVSPDYLEGAVRLQDENRRVAEENRRRMREIEIERAQLEALARERQQYIPQQPQYEIDPAIRPIYEEVSTLKKMLLEERQQRTQMEEHSRRVQQVAQELDGEYLQIMRGMPSQSRVDRDRFFETMGEIYPTENGELPPGITPQKAAYNTAKFLGLISGNGGGYRATVPQPNPRDRRAQYIVPATAGGGAQTTEQSEIDLSPQKAGESNEQYIARMTRARQAISNQGIGLAGLMKDKQIISSG